jgi:ketosteroid isomerase-like protein
MTEDAAVLACFNAFRDALMTNDLETLDGLMTPDYRSFNLRGVLEGREVVLEAYGAGDVQLNVWEVTDLQVEVFSEVGVLTGKGFIAGTWQGNEWSHHLRFLDIYRKTHGSWQLHLSQSTPLVDEAD